MEERESPASSQLLPLDLRHLRALVAERLHPNPRLWHMTENDPGLLATPSEPSGPRAFSPIRASGYSVKHALYLRIILNPEIDVPLKNVKKRLVDHNFISQHSWNEAAHSLGLMDPYSSLIKDHNIPRIRHVLEFDRLVELIRADERDVHSEIPWGSYGHFHSAATSFNTLAETEPRLRVQILPVGDETFMEGIQAAARRATAQPRPLPDDGTAQIAYEERVTAFVASYITALTTCHHTTSRLDCVVKPDRTRFNFADRSFQVRCAVDATIGREAADIARNRPLIPQRGSMRGLSDNIKLARKLEQTTLSAWQFLLTCEFKANRQLRNTAGIRAKAMVQLGFNLAARIYNMYSAERMVNQRVFSGDRSIMALLVIGCEFIPVIAVYNSRWLQYIFDPDSLVLESTTSEADCLRLETLGSYNILQRERGIGVFACSTILLAMLIKSYSPPESSAPSSESEYQSIAQQSQTLREQALAIRPGPTHASRIPSASVLTTSRVDTVEGASRSSSRHENDDHSKSSGHRDRTSTSSRKHMSKSGSSSKHVSRKHDSSTSKTQSEDQDEVIPPVPRGKHRK